MDCFGTYFTHVKPNVTRVQSATQSTASVHTLHMPKPNVTRVQSATEWTASVPTLHMPKPNAKCCEMRQRNAKSCESTVLAMPKHVMKFVLQVVRNGALRLYTCPNV